MTNINLFKLNGVLISTAKKTFGDGKELVEATVSQTKEWRGDKFTKVYPVSAFGDVAKTLLEIKPGTEIIVDGSIRSSAGSKDPSRFFINLTAANVTKCSDVQANKKAETASFEDDGIEVPF